MVERNAPSSHSRDDRRKRAAGQALPGRNESNDALSRMTIK
jgi:hypothetical protein